jgi:hypothetical protein
MYCKGQRQGLATDTSAECHAAATHWSWIGVTCRDLRGDARDKALMKLGFPANTDFEGTCKNMRGMIDCTCEPEAVPGEK